MGRAHDCFCSLVLLLIIPGHCLRVVPTNRAMCPTCQGSAVAGKACPRTMSFSDEGTLNGVLAPPAVKKHKMDGAAVKKELFTNETRAIVWGLQARAVQVGLEHLLEVLCFRTNTCSVFYRKPPG